MDVWWLTQYDVAFEMKLSSSQSATGRHRLICLINGQQVVRKDYLAALQMAQAMSR